MAIAFLGKNTCSETFHAGYFARKCVSVIHRSKSSPVSSVHWGVFMGVGKNVCLFSLRPSFRPGNGPGTPLTQPLGFFSFSFHTMGWSPYIVGGLCAYQGQDWADKIRYVKACCKYFWVLTFKMLVHFEEVLKTLLQKSSRGCWASCLK